MAKIKYHKCKSIREFNKICRKYGKYFIKDSLYRNKWYIWLSYDAIGLDNLHKLIPYAKRLKFQNLYHILNVIIDNYKWSFNKQGKTYELVGLEITNEDYYYLYQNTDDDKDFKCSSCVGHFYDI